MSFAIVPFGNTVDIFGTQVGLYGIDPSIGVLFAFAFSAISVYGLMLGGWASGSKYSFLGAMRSAAQLISYEVSMGLSLVGVIITAGTLSLTGIVEQQDGAGIWYFIPQFVGFIVFMVAAFAETSRPPFDLPEADAELVAGYNTEYGGGRFASYYAAEYFHMVIASGIAVTMFFGGWLLPFGHRPADVGRPDRRAREDHARDRRLRVGARDAAAPALRPADVARLEGPPAARDRECARDGRPRGGARLTCPIRSRSSAGRRPATT